MDRETIKQKVNNILTRLLREDWMDDKDFSDLVNVLISAIGGWEKIYTDIQTGIDNGYSAENQFAIMEKLFLRGIKQT